MHKTRIAKKIFATILAQAMAISMILTGPVSSVTAFAAENGKKDEVVYVMTDGDGQIDHIIVSDKLKNVGNLQDILDKSDLTGIENMKGDEDFTENGDGTVTWHAAGNDITYQGESEKELPVDVSISYELDGRPIKAKDLAGKSGKVTIRFDYTNKEKRMVAVNGKEYEVYVPFTMISGMILDGEKFSNVEVENGKSIAEGDKIIVFGYAVPGLKDSLDLSGDLIDEDSLDIPDYVEVTADVKDFSLDMTITAMTNDLLDSLSMDDMDETGEDLGEDMDKLEDATQEVLDGADELRDGTSRAYNGAQTLATNMKTLSGGAKTLEQAMGMYTLGVEKINNNMPGLKQGVSVLDTGASKLAKGTAALKEGTDAYVKGVNALAGGLVGDGTEQNPGYLAGVEQLAAGAKSLSGLSGLGQVSSAISLMAAATSDEATYTGADGEQHATLGYGAATLEGGLGQVIDGVKQMQNGTSGESLKQLAGGLSTASSMMESAQGKVGQASKVLENGSSSLNGAIEAVKTQEEKVETAKKTLQSEKEKLDGEIKEKNQTISSKNEAITDAQKSANGSIDNSIDATINQLEAAKKALKDAETEDVKFSSQIQAIENQISNLKGKKSPVSVTENAISSIEGSQTEIETSGISTESMEGYKAELSEEAGSLAGISLAQEKGTIDQVAKSISDASGSMGSDPMESLVQNLTQLKGGASSLKSGVASLHGNLTTLESSTASFPAAAQGIQALNAGFDTLTQNNETLRNGAKQLLANGSVLTTGMKEVNEGAAQLAGGTGTLKSGAKTLSEGVGTLASNNDKINSGAATLSSGAAQLASGSVTLEEGMSELLAGTDTLKEGLEEYKEEGIQKILDLYHDNLEGLGDRFEAIKKAGQQYQTYSQLGDGMEGSVKFIYKSGEIK